jgi:DNA-binding MarR family transcriptional regulator
MRIAIADGLAQLSFELQAIIERRAAEHDLSMAQARLLGVLRDRAPTMNVLAKLLGLDKSSASGLVDRAERRGLVTRIPSTDDKRSVLVALTDDGQAIVSAAVADFSSDIEAMLDLLPRSDRVALERIVSRLLVAYAAR